MIVLDNAIMMTACKSPEMPSFKLDTLLPYLLLFASRSGKIVTGQIVIASGLTIVVVKTNLHSCTRTRTHALQK